MCSRGRRLFLQISCQTSYGKLEPWKGRHDQRQLRFVIGWGRSWWIGWGRDSHHRSLGREQLRPWLPCGAERLRRLRGHEQTQPRCISCCIQLSVASHSRQIYPFQLILKPHQSNLSRPLKSISLSTWRQMVRFEWCQDAICYVRFTCVRQLPQEVPNQ